MKKLILLLFSVMGSFHQNVNSQVLTGKITDNSTGVPLPDATIMILQSRAGTHSDETGSYSVTLRPGKHTMVVKFVGYVSGKKDIIIKEGAVDTLDFQLIPENYEQEQIVVTANKLAMNRNNVPMNVTVISEQEIEQSSESNILPLISVHVPGLFVTERGVTGFGLAGGSAGKISIRGVGGGDASFPVLLLIDGQPQFMGMMGHSIPDTYISSDIEKVEVVKGPASILYGNGAMGGAINLITARQKEEGFSLKGRFMTGSFNTRKYASSLGYGKKQFSVIASYNHDQTKGDRPNSDFRIDNGYLKLGYEINGHFSLDANVNYSSFKAYDPGSIYATDPGLYDNKSQWVDIERSNVYFTLSDKFDKAEGGLKAYYMQGDHSIYDGWLSDDENKGVGVYQGIRLFPGNLLNIGFDMKQYGGRGTASSLGQLSGTWLNVEEIGGYAILRQQFSGRFILSAGIRFDHHSVNGEEWIPQFGAAYTAGLTTTIKASVSKGFRNPTVRDLYLFPAANSALLPETMWNHELTLSRDFDRQRGNAEFTLYTLKGENLIMQAPNPAPPPPVKNQNTGAFRHSGFELDVNYQFPGGLTMKAGYSHLYMDTPKVGSPEQQLFLSGNYRNGRFDFTANLQFTDDLYTKTEPLNKMTRESFVLLSGKVSCQLLKSLTLFISGENLLNQDYQVQYGYPMPGITLFAGVNFNFH